MSCYESVQEKVRRLLLEEGEPPCERCIKACYDPPGDGGPGEWWCSLKVMPGEEGCIKKSLIDTAVKMICLEINILDEDMERYND